MSQIITLSSDGTRNRKRGARRWHRINHCFNAGHSFRHPYRCRLPLSLATAIALTEHTRDLTRSAVVLVHAGLDVLARAVESYSDCSETHFSSHRDWGSAVRMLYPED